MDGAQVCQGEHGLKYSTNDITKDTPTRDNPPDIRQQLMMVLKNQPQASDMMWSLFCAAAESYKCDSLLRPFPKMFVDQFGDKDVYAMRRVANSIPSVIKMLELLETNCADSQQIELMHFVLIQSKSFRIRSVKKTDFPAIIEKVQKWGSLQPPPSFIFEVDHSQRASSAKFDALAKIHGVRYGFHGSRLENFYSILHHGLQASLNKVAAFGPGVYLSGDVRVSMPYSPTGMTWEASMFGEKLSVIALCQMIDHPDVRCQDDKISNRKYAGAYSEVPHKYFVVQNSDLVRVTHLLVYSQPKLRSDKTWLFYVKCICLPVILYVILLLILSTVNRSIR